VPVIRGSNLSNDGRTPLVENDYAFVSPEKADELDRASARKGDLIFTCWGTVNQVGLIDKNAAYDRYIVSNKQMKLTPDPRKANSRFLFYLFSSFDLQRRMRDLNIGSSVPGFNLGQLKSLRFQVPPLAEQNAIAGVLEDVDNLIGALDALIAKKRALRSGSMQQLTSGQIRLRGFQRMSGFRDTEVGLVPKDWELRELRKVSSMHGRIGWQGLKQTEFNSNTDDPFLITGMNFKDGDIAWEEVYNVSLSRWKLAPEIQLRTGDVLMTKDGTIGKLLYVSHIPSPGLATLNSHLLVFRPINKSFVPRFLYHQLQSRRFMEYIELTKSGSTFFGIGQGTTGRFQVMLPPIEEQEAIAKVLSEQDAEIAAEERRLQKVKAIKLGMMEVLLSGRGRLASSEAVA